MLRAFNLRKLSAINLKNIWGNDRRIQRARWTAVAGTASRAISILVKLVSIPLSLTLLGAEGYGIWLTLVALMAWMGLADLGAPAGLYNSLTQALSRNDTIEARGLVSSAFFTLLVLCLLATLVYLLGVTIVPAPRLFNIRDFDATDIYHALLL